MPKKRGLKFYNRYDDKNHFLTDLKDSFRNSQEAYIFTYVFDNVGYDLICGGTTNKKQIKLLVNISESGVFESLDALNELFRLSKTKRHKIKIKYYTVKNGLFHPKLYFFTNSNTRVVFIGSSNFTGAGLYYKNVETNISLTDEDTETLNKIGEYCKRQWKDASPLNENILRKLKSPKHESSSYNDEGDTKVPPSKGKFPPWPPSPNPIKSYVKRRRKKPVQYKDIERFMRSFNNKLQPPFKNKFEVVSYHRELLAGLVENAEQKIGLRYEFDFGKSEGVTSYDVKQIEVGSYAKEQGKRFSIYLESERNRREFFYLLKKYWKKYQVEIRVSKTKGQPKPHTETQKQLPQRFGEFENSIKEMKKINYGNDWRTASVWISKKIKRQDEKSLKKHMEELEPFYDFIKKTFVSGTKGMSTVKEVNVFEGLLEREIKKIIKTDRRNGNALYWEQRRKKDRAAVNELIKSEWSRNDFKDFIVKITNSHQFDQQFASNCKQLYTVRNKDKLKRLFHRLYKQGEINALEETKKIKHFGWWILPTFLLHLKEPEKYNILVRGCGNIVLKQKRGIVKLQRGSGVSEKYTAFNEWANKIRNDKGLKHYEMDILFTRVRNSWKERYK